MIETTGTEILRQALFARSRSGYLARLARDHGLALASLEEFTHGRARLPIDTLNVLAAEIFNASLDAQSDRLRKLNTQTATPLNAPGVLATFDPKSSSYPPAYTPPDSKYYPYQGPRGPAGEEPVQPKPTRPGWAE